MCTATCLSEPSPPEYYVGVTMSASSIVNTPTRLVQYILANLTGNATSLNQTSCQKPDDLENESKHVRT